MDRFPRFEELNEAAATSSDKADIQRVIPAAIWVVKTITAVIICGAVLSLPTCFAIDVRPIIPKLDPPLARNGKIVTSNYCSG